MTTLIPVVDRLKSRFGVRKVCIVADRGMISQETIAALEQPGRDWQYILGARMRSQKEVKEEVLARAGRYRVVHPPRIKSDDPSPLKVKEVWVEDRRYIVCLNEDEARKDAADREAIVAALREQLHSGDKSLVGNKGYRRYLGGGGPDHFQVDEAKIAKDARYDGKWVLRTNTELDAAEVALQYKQLGMVEHWFRSCQSLLQTRPIFHRRDETIRGHVCRFRSGGGKLFRSGGSHLSGCGASRSRAREGGVRACRSPRRWWDRDRGGWGSGARPMGVVRRDRSCRYRRRGGRWAR